MLIMAARANAFMLVFIAHFAFFLKSGLQDGCLIWRAIKAPENYTR